MEFLIKYSYFFCCGELPLAGRRAKLALGNGDGLICHTGIHLPLRRVIFVLLTAAPGASGLVVHRRVWRSPGVWSV